MGSSDHEDGHGDVAALERAVADLPEIRLAWLFGSQARGTARPDSDLDVAVLVDAAAVEDTDARRATIWRLAGRLGREVGSQRLDLVLLNGAPPAAAPALLRQRVLRDGLLLFERSREERVRFARRTIQNVQDGQGRREWFLGRRIERAKESPRLGGPSDLLEKARGVARLLDQAQGLP